MSKSCLQCGKPLSEKRGDARFCSLSCKNKYSYKGRLGSMVKPINTGMKQKEPLTGETPENTPSGIIKKTDEPPPFPKKTPGNIDASFFNQLMDEKLYNVENKLEQPTVNETNAVKTGSGKAVDGNLGNSVEDEQPVQKYASGAGDLKNTLPKQYISKEVSSINPFYSGYQTELSRLIGLKQGLEKKFISLCAELKNQQDRNGNSLLAGGGLIGAGFGLNIFQAPDLNVPVFRGKHKLKKDKGHSKPSFLQTFLKGLLLASIGTGIGYGIREATKSWREKDKQTKINQVQTRITQLRKEHQAITATIAQLQNTLSETQRFVTKTVRELNPAYVQAMSGLANAEQASLIKQQKPLPKQGNKPQPIVFKSDRIIKATELGQREYKGLHFKGLWREFFGLPSLNVHILIHGNSGEGKSTFCLWFARYLAENFGRVLYVSAEEGLNKTFHDKLKSCEAEVDNLYILDAATGEEFMQEVGENEFHFIILDSLHDMDIDARKLKLIFERYEHTAFICIDQNNKKGDLLGANEKKHLTDVVVNIKNYIAETTKNRFKPKGMVFKTADFTTASNVRLNKPNGRNDPNMGYDLDSDRRGII